MPASPSIVAIIPARGGSKGLPGKNIRDLAGKPLIAYSIEAAKKCSMISDVFVTTDDKDISAASGKYGAQIIDRPAQLATDNSSTYDAVRHALDHLKSNGKTYDYFVLLQPTSPLRNETHIQKCLEQFFSSGAGCAISVCEAEHSPYKAFKLNEKTLVPFVDEKFLDMPRQDLPPVYRQNGAIYVMKCSDFINKTRNFYLAPAMAYIMPAEHSIDIDTSEDFISAGQKIGKQA